MPSFDIVSQVNSMEIENAVNQARKELANRFDFKGSSAEIVLEKNEVKLSAEDQFKIKALEEMVMGKLAKRQISLKNVEKCDPDISPLGHARQVIKIKQGVEPTVAKQITGFIRDLKLKVTTQIQGEEIRVTGKNRDDLQSVIGAVKAHDFPVARISSPWICVVTRSEEHTLNSSHLGISYAVFCLKKKEHTSELQSLRHLVCRLLPEKKSLCLASIAGVLRHGQPCALTSNWDFICC